MKKQEVKIGSKYAVKVSGQVVPVRIVRESRFGGWEGVNIRTGRAVRIKTAGRLRSKWDVSPGAEKLVARMEFEAGGKVRTAYPHKSTRSWVCFDMDEVRGMTVEETIKRLYVVHF